MKINNLKWCFVLAFTVFQQLSFGQTVLKTMKRLPDTGVKTGYTNTPGEDADFLINEPYFIVNSDGTALDTITGLLWQRGDGGEMTIENARKYCDTLTLGGYSNWRLPRVNEAYSILNHQNTNPALDANVFIKNAAQYWWTADVQFNDSQKIWCTNAGGGIGNHPKAETVSAGGTKKFHVRAVRDVTAPVSMQHFTALNSLLVRDEITGLVWSKAPFTDSLTWEDALLYADSCRLGNFTDWRLPNIKELQSIADISRMNPALNTAYYSLAPAMKIWTSTTLPNKTVSAWYLDTRYGITTYDVKTRKNMVLLVRGGSGNVTAGLKSTADKSMVAYPVPFSDVVKLDGISENTYCKVYNLNGKLLQSGALRAILWSELPSGVYLLQVDGRPGALQIVKSAK